MIKTNLLELENWFAKSIIAYPNDNYEQIHGHYDLNKWIAAVKDLVSLESSGYSKPNALTTATQNWDQTEKYNFLNWLKFYQDEQHLKYKTAQQWYNSNDPGYFLPLTNPPKPKFTAPAPNYQEAMQSDDHDLISPQEKKRIIENQRKKIIGRLDSIEKLLRSDEGQLLSGDAEFDNLIGSIYDLKRKINRLNKRTASVKTYEDILVLETNKLSNKGFHKAAGFLKSAADEMLNDVAKENDKTNDKKLPENQGVQDAPEPQEAPKDQPEQKLPTPASPPAPTQSVGNPGQIPSENPQASGAPNNTPDLSKGLTEFLDNLETGSFTAKEDLNDINDIDDELEIQADWNDEDELVIYAQEAPAPSPKPTGDLINKNVVSPATNPIPAPAGNVPKKLPADPNQPVKLPDGNMVDELLNTALKDITIEDVIAKLQEIDKIFKTREIPRQLTLVDMMLSKLGLSSYFDNLAESINKSYDSNQYISGRISEILNVLNSSTGKVVIPNAAVVNNSAEPVRQKLQEDSDKENQRKIVKKQLQNKQLDEMNDNSLNGDQPAPDVQIEAPKTAIPPK